jgi:hypothetical protein
MNGIVVALLLILVFLISGFTDEELDTGCEGLPDTTDFLECMHQDVTVIEDAEFFIDSMDGGDSLDLVDMGGD